MENSNNKLLIMIVRENKKTIALSIVLSLVLFGLGLYTTLISVRDIGGSDIKIISDGKNEGIEVTFDNVIANTDKIWKDKFPLSKEMGIIDSKVTYAFTHEIGNDSVILGKEGWLFFNSSRTVLEYQKTEDTMADYRGAYYHSEIELSEITENVEYVQKHFEEKGIKFALLLCPNKSSIYYEYMPEAYERVEVSRTDMMVDYLSQNGINVIYPKKQFLEDKAEYPLYYKYDSHWNKLGAYEAWTKLLESWGMEITPLGETTIRKSRLADNYHHSARADLAAMVGLRDKFFNDEIEYSVSNNEVGWNDYESEQESGGYSYFYNENADIDSTILLVGDSYQSALVPAMCDKFKHVYLCYRRNYSPDMEKKFSPNYVIVEWVERNTADVIKIKKIMLGE